MFPEKQQGGTCAVCLLFGSWLAQPERLLPAYSTRPLSPPNGDRHPLAHNHLHNHSLQTVGPPTPSQTHGDYGSGEHLSHEESPVGPRHHHRHSEQFTQPDLQQLESKLGHTQSHPRDILLYENDHCEYKKTLQGTLGRDLQDHMPRHIYTTHRVMCTSSHTWAHTNTTHVTQLMPHLHTHKLTNSTKVTCTYTP